MRLRTLAYIAIGIMAIIVLLIVVKVVKDGRNVNFTEDITPEAPQISKDDAIYGNLSATNKIVIFGYAGCENCEEVQKSVRELIDEGVDAVLVWEDFPNTSLVAESYSSAIAMRCAQEQDAFWDYQPFVFAGRNLETSTYVQIATDLELKTKKFARCLENGEGAEIVQQSIEEGTALRITATPTIFVNGIRHTGMLTQRQIQDLLIQP